MSIAGYNLSTNGVAIINGLNLTNVTINGGNISLNPANIVSGGIRVSANDLIRIVS